MALPKDLRFWGIGGVGMSALAQHFHRLGHRITGYDREASPFTEKLEALGIPVDYTPRIEALEEAKGVIYTPAIPSDFPEWEAVRRLHLPVWRRAEALAIAVAPYQTLAVAGAHGKTSTAAILTWLLHALGESPTAFVGGMMRNFESNYVAGTGQWAVVEADEYDKAMLRLHPAHAIIQSMEPDHLEIYGTAEGVEAAYRQFAGQVRGHLVIAPGVPDPGRPFIRYEVETYAVSETQACFTYRWDSHRRKACWGQIGRHFAENAAAALTLLEVLGYAPDRLHEALTHFHGVARRMELHKAGSHIVVSDYAHHPTEIRRTLQALREAYPAHRLIAIFQPHLYSRTVFFAKDFAQALGMADYVVLFPIYAARESSTPHISHKLISQHLTVPHREVIPLESDMSWLSDLPVSSPSVVALLGAGDIYRLTVAVQLLLTKK